MITATDIPDEAVYDEEINTALEEFESLAYWTFKPRADQPERFDQQTSFLESQTKGVKILLGGTGAGTTTTATRAMAQFLMSTPPPRKNTPFWVVGPDLETTMQTVWAEKICALGHIPPSEINYDQIRWKSPRSNLPYSVPLLEWPGRPGKNWVVEFKAWKQGRVAFQARAIGGFFFLEQFPFAVLEEVLARCREYEYPGSKLVEFTPIDPAIGSEFLNMIEDGAFPEGWELFHLNTKCAAEAGHISQTWFEEFYATVPDEMRETRLTGRLPKWSGLIYSGFSRNVHLVGDEVIDHPVGVYYYRAIDWGAGPENPFAAVWAYRNALGQWFIFDEYKSADDLMVTEHLKNVADKWVWPAANPYYGATYADPSGKAFLRIAARLPELCPGYDKMPMQAASNDVLPGIERVQYLLQVDPALATPEHPEGQPRLFIHKDNCPELIKEISKYKWAERPRDSMSETREDSKVKPVKRDDHLVDALRYLLFTSRQHTIAAPREVDVRERNAVASRTIRHDRRREAHKLGRKK